MPDIHQFNHAAMATHFQVRIVHGEKRYAAQAAQAAFNLVDSLESCLSRFRSNSDIARAAHLAPGEKMRLSEPAFACLQIAKKMEVVTRSAFSATDLRKPRFPDSESISADWSETLTLYAMSEQPRHRPGW